MRVLLRFDWLQRLLRNNLFYRFRWGQRLGWWLWSHTDTKCPYCIYEDDDDDWETMCDCFCYARRHHE